MKFRHLIFMIASASIMLSACEKVTGILKGYIDIPEGALPSKEFTLNNLPDEPFADDAIKVVSTEENAPFYSLELMSDGHYLFCKSQPSGSHMSVRTRAAADENGTVEYPDGSQYGKFEKLDDKEYHLSNGITVDLKEATGTNQRIQFIDDIGRTSNVYVNTEAPAYTGDGTKSLCRTWDLNSIDMWAYYHGINLFHLKQSIEDGELKTSFKVIGEGNVEQDDYIEEETTMCEKVVFTSSKTYICFYMDGSSMLSSWEWVDEEQGILRYIHDEYEDIDVIGDGRVTVRFAGKQMRIYEDYTETDIDDYSGDEEEEEEDDEEGIRFVIVNTLTAAN